jgi:hypothetical protein
MIVSLVGARLLVAFAATVPTAPAQAASAASTAAAGSSAAAPALMPTASAAFVRTFSMALMMGAAARVALPSARTLLFRAVLAAPSMPAAALPLVSASLILGRSLGIRRMLGMRPWLLCGTCGRDGSAQLRQDLFQHTVFESGDPLPF